MNIGIYYIKLKPTDQVYIGQSRNIRNRMRRHIKDLSTDSHSNSFLQSLWNNYSPSNDFEFGILEECSIETLIDREIYWMLQTPKELLINQVTPNEVNHLWSGTEEDKLKFRELIIRGIQQKKLKGELSEEEKFILGKERAKITKEFCKKLIPRYGKHFTSKERSGDQWEVQFPSGETRIISNLTKFCKENDLSYSVMFEVLSGRPVNRGAGKKRRRLSHKGYKLLKKM